MSSLLKLPPSSYDGDGMESPANFPPLKADLVDNLEVAGRCDPLPALPEAQRRMLASPEKLFREAPPGLERFPGFFAGERKEYLSLVGRQ